MTQDSAKPISGKSLNEVAEILVNLMNEEGGAASGLSQVEGEVTGGLRGRGCEAPLSYYAAGNALTLQDATSLCFAKFVPLVASPKATNEWPDSVIESGSGLGYHRWLGGSKR